MQNKNSIIIFITVTIVVWSIFSLLHFNQIPNQYVTKYARNNYVEANYDDLIQIHMKYNIRTKCETQKSLDLDYHLQRNTSNKYAFDNNFVVDGYHKLVYCFHEKVGSTIWMRHFLKLMPEELQRKYKMKSMKQYYNLHKLVLKHFALDISGSIDINKHFQLNRYFVFSFVRHPFDRLVSAYVDKVETLNVKKSTAKVFVDLITFMKMHYGNISFVNFISYVLQQFEVHKYVNEHWKPFYSQCGYCDIDYSFIGRMETFEEDVRFVLSHNNLTEIIPLEDSEQHMNSHRTTKELKVEVEKDDKGKIKAAQRTRIYFQRLTNESIRHLYNLYKLDFELFQYSLEEFI